MSYLDKLRKNREEIADQTRKAIDDDGKSKYGDSRFWKLTRGKDGNGDAVIRFLPAPEGEKSPFVNKHVHNFPGASGAYFVENCPTTIGQQCPVCASNRAIWKSNSEDAARKIIGQKKRQLKYYSNILVVDDPSNANNNGKVFLFEYGPKIFEKIKNAQNPQNSRIKAVDAFDIDYGANFILVATYENKQVNYDSCAFEQSSPISDNDKELVSILESMHSLESLVSSDNFKSYEELEKIFDNVENGVSRRKVKEDVETEESEEFDFSDSKKDDTESEVNLDDLPF